MAMYRKVMRERSTQQSRGMQQSEFKQGSGRIRLRSSHRRGASNQMFRISHSRPGAWEPPVKDVDRDDMVARRSDGKKR
jgi:hypothetical protein